MAVSPKAKSYLRAQAPLIEERGFWNCLAAVETLAALLLEEGRSPWIGRLRKSETRGDAVFHAPLMPLRFHGAITWTTHYVCVERGIVYDPAAARPLPLGRYSKSVFGEEIPIETFVAEGDVESYLKAPKRTNR
jgi:hypothetical protein